VLDSPTLKPGTGLPAEQIGAPDRLRRMAQDDIIDRIRLSAVLASDASERRREGLCWGRKISYALSAAPSIGVTKLSGA
jgi:hypothetical protein